MNMRAVVVKKPGPVEGMQIEVLPIPHPQKGEVLIKVKASGVNRGDMMQRKGFYPPPSGSSPLLGLEVAGEIVKVGEGVESTFLKKEVCALLTGGGYAEYCTAPIGQCLTLPKGLSMVEAASLPETYFTVWSCVFDSAKLAKGESLFVQGGSSGIGVTAIQLASALGHTVYATAGTEEKCSTCVKLGAKRCINYKTENFVKVIKEVTEDRGVNVILDMVGGDYIEKEMSILALEGRLVLIAALGGTKASIDLKDVLAKRLTLIGSTLRSRSIEFKYQIAKKLEKSVWPLFEAKKIKPIIYKTFPLENAADAHRLMESGEHIGKIVLTV